MGETENKIEIAEESQMEKDSKTFLKNIDNLVREYYIEGTLTRRRGKTIPKGESADELVNEFILKYPGEENLFALLGKVNDRYIPEPDVDTENTPMAFYLASGAIM